MWHEEVKERIKDMSFKEAYEIAEDFIVDNCLDDPEFWEAIIQGIKDSWPNKKNMLKELLDMISHGKGKELENYVKNLIYDNELIGIE